MTTLLERLIPGDGGPRFRAKPDIGISRALARLESGEPGHEVIRTFELEAADLIAALAHAGLGDEGELGPPLIQQLPTRPGLLEALREPSLARLFSRAPRDVRLALSSGLLQIHDFWDESHSAAQLADDLREKSFSAYWHGIAHRREPDPGNAAYWFRRVRLSFGPVLGAAARPIGQGEGESGPVSWVVGQGGWDNTAMIELCTGARPGTAEERVARRLQRSEMLVLLGLTFDGLVHGDRGILPEAR